VVAASTGDFDELSGRPVLEAFLVDSVEVVSSSQSNQLPE
jgi:hypothetical protein